MTSLKNFLLPALFASLLSAPIVQAQQHPVAKPQQYLYLLRVAPHLHDQAKWSDKDKAATGAHFERLKNATVVVVSHQPATLEKFCRSAAVLRNGQLYTFETLEEAKRLYDYQA